MIGPPADSERGAGLTAGPTGTIRPAMRISTTALLAACVLLAACGKSDSDRSDARASDTKPVATDTKLVATAPVTPPAPRSVPSATDKLIPADAALLAHVDIQRLARSPLWAANHSLMDADPEVKKQLAALAACNMAFDGLRSLDIGVAADGLNFAIVATGTGIGKPENLQCLRARSDSKDWTLDAAGPNGRPRLVADNSEAFGHSVDDDTMAFASKNWDASVLGLLTGTGTSVRDGLLKDVLAQADQSQAVWFAGNLPPQLAALATAAPGMQSMSGLKSIAGSLDLSAGLGLVLAFGLDNAERARTTLAQVQQQFASVKPAASLLGIPGTAVDKVSFSTRDAQVTMTASLTMEEINAMTTNMRRAAAAPSGPLGTVPPPIDQGKDPTRDAPSPGTTNTTPPPTTSPTASPHGTDSRPTPATPPTPAPRPM